MRFRRRASTSVVAVLAIAASLGAALAVPAPAVGQGPLPACRYDDVLTAPRDYADWAITLVDTILRVGKGYAPPDLVPVSEAGIGGIGMVRAIAVKDLAAMTTAAKAAGNPIAVASAYRSYATQQRVFQYWVNVSSYQEALAYSARPGHSEHQLGVAIDFKSAGGGAPWRGSDWALSPAGSWMRKHAWEYGWVQSYPKNQKAQTCYAYEAWHFRYVGRDLAAAIHTSGLTSREYLWSHFTTADVAGASPGPSSSAEASAAPSGSPFTPEPSATNGSPPAASPVSSPAPVRAGLDSVTLAAGLVLVALVTALAASLALGHRRTRRRRG